MISAPPIPLPPVSKSVGEGGTHAFILQMENFETALATVPASRPRQNATPRKDEAGLPASGTRKRDAGRPDNPADRKSVSTFGGFTIVPTRPVTQVVTQEHSDDPHPGSEGDASRVQAAMTELPESPATPASLPTISVTKGNQTAPMAPLSFAAKIKAPEPQSEAAPDRPKPQILNPSVVAVASAWKKAQHEGQATTPDGNADNAPIPSTGTPDSASGAPAAGSGSVVPASNILPSGILSSNTSSRSEAAHAEPSVSAPKETEPLAVARPQGMGTQLKDLSFNIAQPGRSSVQLRVMERSGELSIAVHTASADLNQQLRAGLGDLTKKLSDTGFHSEIWRPDVQTVGASGDTASAKNQGGQGNGNQSGNSGGNPQSPSGGSQQGMGQRGQNQSNRPRWVEELENGVQAASKTTGEIYGFRS
jgi:hypothetical protein